MRISDWSSDVCSSDLPERLPAIQAATFEVVAAKPVDDPLRYEKPLPLDLLPFQRRNDKYYSIGTAFSIGGGRYVTAAHVLMTGANRLRGPPALRDNGGKVNPKIGRAWSSERVCGLGWFWGGRGNKNKKKK